MEAKNVLKVFFFSIPQVLKLSMAKYNELFFIRAPNDELDNDQREKKNPTTLHSKTTRLACKEYVCVLSCTQLKKNKINSRSILPPTTHATVINIRSVCDARTL